MAHRSSPWARSLSRQALPAAALLVGLAGVADAATSVSSRSTGGNINVAFNYLPPYEDVDAASGLGLVQVATGGSTVGNGPWAGTTIASSGMAFADHGILKARVEATASACCGTSRSTAAFTDNFRLQAASPTVQTETFTVTLAHDWVLQRLAAYSDNFGAATGRVELLLSIRGTDSFDPTYSARRIDDFNYGAIYGGDIVRSFLNGTEGQWPDVLSLTAPMRFGKDYTLRAELVVHLQATSRASMALLADNSAYWGGIQQVVVEGASAVAFGVTSTSGTDWSQSFVPAPVPEPASAALLLAGGTLLAAAARRRAAVAS
jgi:PEP-CTERM motif